MTKLLEQAIAQVKQLSELEQDTIAALILEELEDERLWNEAFSSSAKVLEKLLAEAEAEDRASLTQDFNPEER